jgi:hypothetical protein
MDCIPEAIILYFPCESFKVLERKTYSYIKIYNNLPCNIFSLRNDRPRFNTELYKYLLTNTFDSVKEFLECECRKLHNKNFIMFSLIC